MAAVLAKGVRAAGVAAEAEAAVATVVGAKVVAEGADARGATMAVGVVAMETEEAREAVVVVRVAQEVATEGAVGAYNPTARMHHPLLRPPRGGQCTSRPNDLALQVGSNSSWGEAEG